MARFDPHPPPLGAGSGELVAYPAGDLLTAIAEKHQARVLDAHDPRARVVYSWRPTRPLRLIDLTGHAAVRLGASQAINSGPKNVTRRWARTLRTTWPQADGLHYCSVMTGRSCASLWAPAASTFGSAQELTIMVDFPGQQWRDLLRAACVRLGYDLLL